MAGIRDLNVKFQHIFLTTLWCCRSTLASGGVPVPLKAEGRHQVMRALVSPDDKKSQ